MTEGLRGWYLADVRCPLGHKIGEVYHDGHDDRGTPECVRLRAYAFAKGLTASEAAWAIVDRRVSLDDEESFRPPTDGWEGPHER